MFILLTYKKVQIPRFSKVPLGLIVQKTPSIKLSLSARTLNLPHRGFSYKQFMGNQLILSCSSRGGKDCLYYQLLYEGCGAFALFRPSFFFFVLFLLSFLFLFLKSWLIMNLWIPTYIFFSYIYRQVNDNRLWSWKIIKTLQFFILVFKVKFT